MATTGKYYLLQKIKVAACKSATNNIFFIMYIQMIWRWKVLRGVRQKGERKELREAETVLVAGGDEVVVMVMAEVGAGEDEVAVMVMAEVGAGEDEDEVEMEMVVVGVWEEEVGVKMEEVWMSEMSDGEAEVEEGEPAVATPDHVVVVAVAVAPGSWPY